MAFCQDSFRARQAVWRWLRQSVQSPPDRAQPQACERGSEERHQYPDVEFSTIRHGRDQHGHKLIVWGHIIHFPLPGSSRR